MRKWILMLSLIPMVTMPLDALEIKNGKAASSLSGGATWFFVSEATSPLNMNGYAINSSSGLTVINGSISNGTTTPLALLHLSSDTGKSVSNPTYIIVSTGTGDIFRVENSSVTISTAILLVNVTNYVRGVPFQVGPITLGAGGRTLAATGVLALFSVPTAVVNNRIVVKAAAIEAQFGVGANANAHLGTFTNNGVDIRINDQQIATWDTSGNHFLITAGAKLVIGATSGPSVLDVVGGSETIRGARAALTVAATNFVTYAGGGCSIGTNTYSGTPLFIDGSGSNQRGIVRLSSDTLDLWRQDGSSNTVGTSQIIGPVSASAIGNYVWAAASSPLLGTNYIAAVSSWTHFTFSGSSPTVTSCGSTPNGSIIGGSDEAGQIQIGGGAVVSCTLLFGNPWKNLPANPTCVMSDNSTTVSPSFDSANSNNTQLTIKLSGILGGGVVNYHCFGVRE